MVRRRLCVVVSCLAIGLAAVSCSSNDNGGGGGGGGGGGDSVGATEKDFAIALDNSSADSGSVTFNIHNDGPSTHEFVVFKTDLSEDQLPVSNGAVDEKGQGLTHIDEVEDIAANADETLTVDLDPGNYVVICNLPGHYQQGMHASLTVNG